MSSFSALLLIGQEDLGEAQTEFLVQILKSVPSERLCEYVSDIFGGSDADDVQVTIVDEITHGVVFCANVFDIGVVGWIVSE
jgi:hypothetical protein